MDEKVLFGQRLLELRKNANKNQTDVAKALGISQPAYQNYENGRREAGYSTIVKLADFYGVTTDYLLGREPPQNPLLAMGIDLTRVDDDAFIKAYRNLPELGKIILVDAMRTLAEAAKGKSGDVSVPDYGPMRHSATLEELRAANEAKKNA